MRHVLDLFGENLSKEQTTIKPTIRKRENHPQCLTSKILYKKVNYSTATIN